LRLTRTCGRTRGENELGQCEPGHDESARDEAQSVDGAEETERRDERAHLDAPANGGGALRVSATWPRQGGIALFDGESDERDGARESQG
jgi:hypothetical protein